MIRNSTLTLVAILFLLPAADAQDTVPEPAEPADAVEDETGAGDESFDPAEQTVGVAESGEDEDEDSEDGQRSDLEDDPDATDEERLITEFARYRRLMQEGTLDAADVAAKRIVEMAIRVYGPDSLEPANALNNLAIVQHSNNQYESAIQNFSSSVSIIESLENRLHYGLVNPLKGLGAAQLGSGRPDLAFRTFDRAAHITHVNEGPHNLDQVEILESMAETHIRMNNMKAARDTLDRIHIINVKHFEKNPLGLLPSLMSRADWQHRAGYYIDERMTYRRAIRIIESSSGKNDPMLVEPLRRLGESFYFVDLTLEGSQQPTLVSTGELYFKRAARIAEKADDMDWRERALSTLALADYYTYVDSHSRARKIYRNVWEQLSIDDAARRALRAEWFDEPTPLREIPLPTFASDAPIRGTSPENVATGRVEAEYMVSARGRVRSMKTIVTPKEFSDMQRLVHREIRSRVYRPRIIDGEAVDAKDLTYAHEFQYLKSDLEQRRAEDADDAAERAPVKETAEQPDEASDDD